MSARKFMYAMDDEIIRLGASDMPLDVAKRRTIEMLRASYAEDAKRRQEKKTLEREAWLRMNYASWPGLKEDILAALNAMPGDMLTVAEMSNWTAVLGLKRSREALTTARSRRAIPKGRDGSFSMSLVTERDMLDDMGECPVTLSDALEWGGRNGMKRSGSLVEDLRATNAVRAANALPAFTIIADKPRQGPLPRLIVHDAGDRA